MHFENPNVKRILSTNTELLTAPDELVLTNCQDFSKQVDIEYLRWLISNGQEDSFYKLNIWVKTRPLVIERDKYECQRCKYHGKLTVVRKRAYVHHIAELKLFPNWCLNFNNLITLCHTCHELTHDRIWNNLPTIETYDNFDAVEKW